MASIFAGRIIGARWSGGLFFQVLGITARAGIIGLALMALAGSAVQSRGAALEWIPPSSGDVAGYVLAVRERDDDAPLLVNAGANLRMDLGFINRVPGGDSVVIQVGAYDAYGRIGDYSKPLQISRRAFGLTAPFPSWEAYAKQYSAALLALNAAFSPQRTDVLSACPTPIPLGEEVQIFDQTKEPRLQGDWRVIGVWKQTAGPASAWLSKWGTLVVRVKIGRAHV